ncbi:DUF169 domain-containing protein [Acidaminobacterium chupaoyuni]
MNSEWADSVEKLYCALELKRRAVAVKLLRTEEEYESADAIALQKPINYCQMVAAATNGNRIKAKSESFKCRSGARVLGIDPSDPKNGHGENWARLKLYENAELSRNIREELVYLKEPAFGVLLSPIEQATETPDVVLIAANPYNAMRITQGYAYHYGMPKSVNMIGNQAVCLECTARPHALQDMNISLLCIGTRHRAGWADDEMAVGIPAAQFAKVVDGLMNTLNQMENDHNKAVIEKKLKAKNIVFPIRYGYNYYTEC